ncbi:hypothetical protein BaRGS_00040188 [Batillaria attramentaria]|uniref:Uncharacterized protein n=1 Tax=Batillaria attramentaria TaxID=370345 RepID=A0ABD0J0X9_9CAEN
MTARLTVVFEFNKPGLPKKLAVIQVLCCHGCTTDGRVRASHLTVRNQVASKRFFRWSQSTRAENDVDSSSD